MQNLRIILLTVLLALLAVLQAWAQGTAFTYQGRLNQNGGPATGLYDLRFLVYASPVAPTPIGVPLTLSSVPVTNGLFSATLDFGAGVFNGPPRWLEIAVRTNGAAGFVTLEQRQPIIAVPYATHAGTASNIVNGSVVTSLNGLRDNVSLAAGANVTITPSGNTLTIASAGAGGSGIWSTLNNNAYYMAGNVGIGNNNPNARLYVTSQTASPGDNTATFYAPAIGPNASHIHYGTTGDWFVRSAKPEGKIVLQDFGGNVGIGTATPLSKLDIAAQDALRITGFQPFITMSDTAGFGLIRKAKRYLQVVDGDLAFLYQPECNVFPCTQPTESHMTIRFNSLVGIGTPLPQTKLHLYHGPDSVSHRIETGGGVNAWSRTEYANANGMWITGTSRSFNGDQFYIHRVGAPGITFGIQPNGDAALQGTLTCKVLSITGGADLAEPFKMSEDEIPKGAVVVIDEGNPGHLKLSSEAYDTRVAGVVSGANGVRPGISLHQEGTLEGGENVALSGRVYVQADAAQGAIKPGDLLTTSDTPGHAMRVGDPSRAQGAVLGKAMTGLRNGKGLVLVLVTLQ